MITTANGTYGTEASPYQSAPKEQGVGGVIANRQRGSDQVTIRQQARPAVRIDNSFDATPSLQIVPIQVGTYLSIVGGVVTYVGDQPQPPVTTAAPTTAAPTTAAPTTQPPTTLPPTTVPPTTAPPTTLPPTTLPPTTLPPTTLPPTTMPPTTLPPTTLPPTTLPPTTLPPTTIPPTTPPP